MIHEPVLEISCGQKQCAQTDRQTDTQTDRHTPMTTRPYGLQRRARKKLAPFLGAPLVARVGIGCLVTLVIGDLGSLVELSCQTPYLCFGAFSNKVSSGRRSLVHGRTRSRTVKTFYPVATLTLAVTQPQTGRRKTKDVSPIRQGWECQSRKSHSNVQYLV